LALPFDDPRDIFKSALGEVKSDHQISCPQHPSTERISHANSKNLVPDDQLRIVDQCDIGEQFLDLPRVTDLRDLQATDFVDSGFTSNVITITVTPANGVPSVASTVPLMGTP